MRDSISVGWCVGVDSCARRQQDERTAETEGGKFQSNPSVQLRSPSPPAPVLVPLAAIARLAAAAGLLANSWYGCFSRSDFPYLLIVVLNLFFR